MPSSPSYKRDYKQERITAKKRGETDVGSKSADATRHRARRKYEAAHGPLPDNVDVDHKKHFKDGGSNSIKNLRARPQHENQADNTHKGRNQNSRKKK